MATLLYLLRILSLALWVGSIAFFAVGVAPVAFHVLPTHEAGLVVGGSLHVLHAIALWCGGVYLAAALLPLAKNDSPAYAEWHRATLGLLMLCLTAFSSFSILPRMERDRALAGGAIENAAPSAPARQDFDRLHHMSEQVEGSVLVLGLLTLVLTCVAFPRQHAPKSGL